MEDFWLLRKELDNKEGIIMRIKKILMIIPLCTLLMASPVTGLHTMAVTIDISDNYDADLLSEESDTAAESSRQNTEDAKESTNDYSTSSTSASSTASSTASTASSTASTATSTATSASTTASTVTPTSTSASTTASTTSTDLPQTGDDDRIMITATVLIASLSVFLTALMSEKYSKKA